MEYLVLWENNQGALSHYPNSGLGASKYFGKPAFVWSKITNSLLSFRFNPTDVFFDDASPAVIFKDDIDYYLLGLMNSAAIQYYLNLLSPTMNNQIGDIRRVPVLYDQDASSTISGLVKRNIELAKADYLQVVTLSKHEMSGANKKSINYLLGELKKLVYIL